MRLIFLGTGASWPTRKRNVSGITLEVDGEHILLDCGEGTQRQLLFTSFSFMKVKRIFITHFHGDHFLGIPGLIQSMALSSRTDPLEIVGPPGIDELVENLINLGHFSRVFEIKTITLEPGTTLSGEKYTVKAMASDHTSPGLIYRIEENPRPGRFDRTKALSLGVPEGPLFRKLQEGAEVEVNGRIVRPEEVIGPPRPGRRLVYTGDTRPVLALEEFADRADVLIHEATFANDMVDRAGKYGHSTAIQAARIAKKAGVKHLILTHISPRYDDGSILLSEAREIFENTIVAEDFMEIRVPLDQ